MPKPLDGDLDAYERATGMILAGMLLRPAPPQIERMLEEMEEETEWLLSLFDKDADRIASYLYGPACAPRAH